MHHKLILVGLLLISILAHKSNASSPFDFIRKLAEKTDLNIKPMQMSPSPSPAPTFGKELPQVQASGFPSMSPAPQPAAGSANETCGTVAYSCHIQNVMIACLLPGPMGAVLVENGGEISLKVNITILPANNTYNDVEVLRHEVKKINVSENVEGNLSIVLSAGDEKCVIPIGIPVLPGNFYKHGGYLLFATAVIIGGAWTSYKLGKTVRQPDGIPYQELEMGQSGSSISSLNVETGQSGSYLSSLNVETAEGWDQGWEDQWDEEKAMQSPGGNYMGNGQPNGLTS